MSKNIKKVGRNKSGQFTKGNNFAVGNKNANKYKKEYAEELIKYFSEPPTRVEYIRDYDAHGKLKHEEPVVLGADYPTFEGFATQIGVTTKTLENWKRDHPLFAKAYELAQDLQKNTLLVNGLGGRYNANFAKFVAMNHHNMADRTEQKLLGDEGMEVIVNVKTPSNS